jgi:putative oxidoreductase
MGDKENLTMNRPSYLLILAGVLSFCAAVFQAVIAFVPAWSAAFGAGDALVSSPLLLLILGLLVALLLVVFGLYGLSGAGVICRLPLLRLGLLVIGLLYSLVGINFIFQVLALLGVLPSAGPIPVYQLLVSLGAFVAALAYLIGLAVNWKRLSTRPARAES